MQLGFAESRLPLGIWGPKASLQDMAGPEERLGKTTSLGGQCHLGKARRAVLGAGGGRGELQDGARQEAERRRAKTQRSLGRSWGLDARASLSPGIISPQCSLYTHIQTRAYPNNVSCLGFSRPQTQDGQERPRG